MEYEDKIALCEKWLAEDFKIDVRSAHRLIYDLDIDTIVFERYEEELNEAEKDLEKEWEYDHAHYNDGWNDHIGV